ncbi:MAG: fatty acid hydroxylase superfamily-domain-containing protein [Monoraphidium minutum]|nr:MAG: fatty acid hydroxylase superfamily-domain-containing protein [Monoraphidium minutum]
MEGALIIYPAAGSKPRRAALAESHARVPYRTQLLGCARHLLLGWPPLANGAGLTLLMGWACPQVSSWMPATWGAAVLQFLALVVLGDFGLYWGHRVQHEVEFLWRFHALHHSIATPSPFSTLYIHKTDAALQGSIPFAIAALIVKPAPAVLYAFLAARIAENALNHSGLDSRLLDLLTLKALPLRAAASFHDAHHKFCNHPRGARNYAESFWVFDWAFGTLSPLCGVAAGAAGAAASAKDA